MVVLICIAIGVLIVSAPWLWDKLHNPAEYETLGKSGERVLYRELVALGVPKSQIFRNVYIPVLGRPGKTTEIDLLILSKKGILIFEHKTYHGKIYGDGRLRKWTQYYHGKRTFLSPVEQNRYHAKCLREFLKEVERERWGVNRGVECFGVGSETSVDARSFEEGIDVERFGESCPIYTFITHSATGVWRVRNLPVEAHFITRKGEFGRIYRKLPDVAVMGEWFETLSERFAKLSRPDDGTMERHVEGMGSRR